VRKAGFEIANGTSVEAAIPKKNNEYDMKMLSEMLIRLKAQFPDKEDATVLMEPDIEYNYLIQVMDAVRGAEIKAEETVYGEEDKEIQRIVLFPDISIGDAP